MALFSNKKKEDVMPRKLNEPSEEVKVHEPTITEELVIPNPPTPEVPPIKRNPEVSPYDEVEYTENVYIQADPADDTLVIQDNSKTITEPELPESLINDSVAVGYNDEESQKQFYDLAISGLDLNGSHILDMGCGRGDFLAHINSIYNGIDTMVDYTGYEINPLLVRAGALKHGNTKSLIHNKNWFEADKDELVYDWVFNILSLSTNYDGYTEDKWEYFDKTIELAMRKAVKGAVFILMSDNAGVTEYTHFPIPEVITRIQDKFMFAIDRTTAMTIYKLGIIK